MICFPNLLSSFKMKVEEAVAMLPLMVPDDEAEGVKCLSEITANTIAKFDSPPDGLKDQKGLQAPNTSLVNKNRFSPNVYLNDKHMESDNQYLKWCKENGLPKEYAMLHVTDDDFNQDYGVTEEIHLLQCDDILNPIVTASNGCKKLSCPVCFSSFDKTIVFKEHVTAHLNPHICSTCGSSFIRKGYFTGHLQSRTGEKPCSRCTNCDNQFATLAALNVHSETHGLRHTCSDCGQGFKSQTGLFIHVRKHAAVDKLTCSECNKILSPISHAEVENSGQVKFYQCPLCLQCFDEPSCIVMHLSKHKKEPNDSNLTTGVQGQLEKSSNSHVPQSDETSKHEHTCEQCGKCFKQKLYLNRHLLRHDEPRFSCDHCSAKFFTNFNLREHMRIHTGERPFVCPLCGKSFRIKVFLKYHINKHYGLKPYQCKYCEKCFSDLTSVSKHTKLHKKLEKS